MKLETQEQTTNAFYFWKGTVEEVYLQYHKHYLRE